MLIDNAANFRFLSELYALDAPSATLLCEYPSSNSDQTIFRNTTDFIIHDPFPPPPPQLLKTLGPHHLMCGWGNRIPVTSQLAPPNSLCDHWQKVFGHDGCPHWKPFEPSDQHIVLFPHQSIQTSSQAIDPAINYALHSKEVIEKIDCPQAEVFDSVRFPCIVKLSHGYAGLGNFLLQSASDETAMRQQLKQHWPESTLVINSVIEDIVSDHGVQFYLRKDGTVVWLGLTEQQFNASKRWCGGTYSSGLQTELIEPFTPIVEATAKYLHSQGCFGVVGVDILTNRAGECFLVDVNPRLTGITPFLIASRIFERDFGYTHGSYAASFRYNGNIEGLLQHADSYDDAKVLVLAAVEQSADDQPHTTCHISVSSESETTTTRIFLELAAR